MGLALEMFELRLWFVYVAATVVLEAWWIGVRAGRGWPAAVGISFLANFFTAMFCPQLCAVGLHTAFVGTTANPNPFLNAVALFCGFGLISAMVESIFWRVFSRREDIRWEDKPILRRSLAAHAIGVPLALAILLIPPYPYVGLQSFAEGRRNMMLRDSLKRLSNDIMAEGQVPKIGSISELLELYPPENGAPEDRWTAAYQPLFGRFSFGDDRAHPLLWNTAVEGKTLDFYSTKDSTIWLVRTADGKDPWWQYDLDLRTGQIRRGNDRLNPQLP